MAKTFEVRKDVVDGLGREVYGIYDLRTGELAAVWEKKAQADADRRELERMVAEDA